MKTIVTLAFIVYLASAAIFPLENSPHALDLPDSSKVYLPHVQSIAASHSFRGNITLKFERFGGRIPVNVQPGNTNNTCGNFGPLWCKYSKLSYGDFTFNGCFTSLSPLVSDPFFSTGDLLPFVIKVTTTVAGNKKATVYMTVDVPTGGQSHDPLWSITGQVFAQFLKLQKTKDYLSMFPLFSDDAVFENIGTGTYHGPIGIVGYYQFVDPNTTDITNVDSYDEYQAVINGNRLMIQGRNQLNFFQYTGPLSPVVDLRFAQYIELNEHGQICNLTNTFDTFPPLQRLPVAAAINQTELCQHIFFNCHSKPGLPRSYLNETGYQTVSDCTNFLAALPLTLHGSPFIDTAGNSSSCRQWHEILTRADPSQHCFHTGKFFVVNGMVNPCGV